jgi:uncharacterized protein (DUF2147 family)
MIDRSTVAALAGLALAALPGLAQAASPNDATGTYLTEDGRARIRVEKCGPQNTNLCGYVVWLKVPLNDKGQPRVDFKNPDPKKQARPSLGLQLIMGLKPQPDGHYGGKIYNADEGKFYDVTMWSDQPSELSVRGCLLGFLCGSQTWSKVTDVVPGQLTAATNQPGGPRSDAEWAPKPAPAKSVGGKSAGDKAAPAPSAAPAEE